MDCTKERSEHVVDMPVWEELVPIIKSMYPSIDREMLADYGIVYNEIVEALELWMEDRGVCCICRNQK
jgi:hypothetical protein